MPPALRHTDVYTGASTEFIGCSWLTLVEFMHNSFCESANSITELMQETRIEQLVDESATIDGIDLIQGARSLKYL